MIISVQLRCAVVSAIATLLVTSCGSGDGPAKRAAVQTALDALPIYVTVPAGTTCHGDAYWGRYAPHAFSGLQHVSVRSVGAPNELRGVQPCTTVTWDATTHLKTQVGNVESGRLRTGRLIVDKVGDEQHTPAGIAVTPFSTHFEWYPMGKELASRHLASAGAQAPNEVAQLRKDADGKWIARIVVI